MLVVSFRVTEISGPAGIAGPRKEECEPETHYLNKSVCFVFVCLFIRSLSIGYYCSPLDQRAWKGQKARELVVGGRLVW